MKDSSRIRTGLAHEGARMDPHGMYIARILDAGLRALAAQSALLHCEQEREHGVAIPTQAFPSLAADIETRLLVLAEALATGRPELYLEQIEWTRSTYAARELAQEPLARNLRCMREVLLRELPPLAHSALSRVLHPAEQGFERPARQSASVLEAQGDLAQPIRRILLAILEGQREAALQLLLAPLAQGHSVSQIEADIIAPLQAEIGLMWQRGEIHVHEEHLGSQIVEEALALLRNQIVPKPSHGKAVLVASIAGNLHDYGARLVADHFRMDGWNSICLGANVPGADLARAVVDFRADLLALSVTLATQVRTTAGIIADVREYCEAAAPAILVGGPPFSLVPDLWSIVGADGSAQSAPQAVRAGRSLLGLA